MDTPDAAYPVPSYTPPVSSDKVWRYQVRPAANQYSAQFDYDAQGRPIDAWKLQKTGTSPWVYVQTHSTYGADGAPVWGQASQVVEDYGSGKINRATTNNAYTSWGKASDVTDAAGHRFVTSFDLDGQVNSVTQMDLATPLTIVSYTYGASGVSLGQPVSVTDGLSGVSQSFSYCALGGGIGQPAGVTETSGGVSYSVSYTYNGAGDRATTTYTTPNGTTRWGYYDYVSVGNPASPSRAFQTLCRLDDAGNRTSEEFHYRYSSDGHLLETAFAQIPFMDSSGHGYTPTVAGDSYYDSAHPASRRARTFYQYDGGGRLSSTATYWDSMPNGGGTYTSEAVLANQCDYELSGLNRALKTASRFYAKNASSPADFALERTETYGYDASLDYLTNANYGDDNPNATPSWTYDAAGNRNDASVVDSLNRATTIGGTAVTNDILGNRLTKDGKTYGWDSLNRLVSIMQPGALALVGGYQYRADGMRVAKVSMTAGTSSVYRYDGQMPMEDVDTVGTSTTVTRYGLGARGLDMIERINSSGTVVGFPIYDAHGNNVATLSRNGSGYAINDRRAYDAWGLVRSQQSAGDPKLRYCASLGHKVDDESGLIYMRARYYEPVTGRFLSEDPGIDSLNWYVYCGCDPVNRIDYSGRAFSDEWPGITKLFSAAIRIFTSSQSSASKIRQLTKIMNKLDSWSEIERVNSGISMSEAEIEEQTSPYMGEAGLLQMRMAELKMKFSQIGFAEGAVMKLSVRCIEAMIELLK